jgi:hypothetical protein
LRVTRNAAHSRISIPGKSAERRLAISCSSRTKRPPPGSGRKRGRFGGTFTRAIRRVNSPGARTTTARFNDRFEMYGKGCAGSTASGVRTGNTWSKKTPSR